MSWTKVFPKIEPDYTQLERVFRREVPDRVPAIELFADDDVIRAVLGHGPEAMKPDKSYEPWQRRCLWQIKYQQVTTPDFINVGMPWLVYHERHVSFAQNTASLAQGDRCWANERDGIITSRSEFDDYPWPQDDIKPQVDAYFDFLAEHVPAGMGIIATSSGVFEWATWLMGYEPMCYALHGQPELVRDVMNRIGQRFVESYDLAAKHEAVRALWLGDDMGFKTATMISPEHLREYIFPWHKRVASVIHAQGKPLLLHACGNLEQVMDDLIDDVGIDAKHSFEDVIMPVAEFRRLYGQRVAVLGGVDVDYISRHKPDDVRRYTREILESCAPGGGFALGTGNSVANYIPIENYAAMLSELAAFNE